MKPIAGCQRAVKRKARSPLMSHFNLLSQVGLAMPALQAVYASSTAPMAPHSSEGGFRSQLD
ncbi:hypothetical protein IQ268_10865 [Oculatella sp. LEGE 06141]|uniref:hypothetical protein n=1 Tax=Oculatella sp. LEGE 06141 TaxID=1828648 RepID=UPI00187E388B|nr:hypothetical protein [Oculatella sp. LEGE 06141]MBE9179062.1 hypothetical protein [Oculatella sp. LEGE 06141]